MGFFGYESTLIAAGSLFRYFIDHNLRFEFLWIVLGFNIFAFFGLLIFSKFFVNRFKGTAWLAVFLIILSFAMGSYARFQAIYRQVSEVANQVHFDRVIYDGSPLKP
jgi:hypothetical protein